MTKVLIIGGMHGNEPLGPAVVGLFKDMPIKNIEVVLANEQAIAQNSRFIKQDLNRSFPGEKDSGDYEKRRAAELLRLCIDYDLVIDFHNTHCPDNDCAFVGESAPTSLYDISASLGLHRIIVADYDCLNKFAPNCLSIEISLSSPLNNAQLWYKKISRLVTSDSLPKSKSYEKYRFVYRMTLEDRDRLNLADKNLRAFRPLDKELVEAMKVSSPAYPIFINDAYTPYNYGGILYKIT